LTASKQELPPTAGKKTEHKPMKETNKQESQKTVQVPEKRDKKDYQRPVCKQHKPLDHVRTWHKKSLPA